MSLALEDENRRSEEDVMIFLFSIEGRVISYYVGFLASREKSG